MPTSFPRDDEPTALHDELASPSYAPRDHQPQTDAELLAAVAASGTVVADVADDDDEPPALLDEPPALLPANFAETLSRRHSRASSLNSSPPPPTSTWMSPERYVLVGGPARGPGVPAQADASGSAQTESASPGATQVDMNGATLNIEPNVDDGTYQAALASMGARALRVESLELVSSALIRRLQALRGLLLCYVCQEALLREDGASSPSSTTTPADDPDDDDEPVRATPCRHLFHEDCLSPWFESNTTCPTCRYDAAPSLPLDFASFLSGASLFDEIAWDGGEPDVQEDEDSYGDDDFPVSSPDSERPTTPPPTRRDGVYVAGNDQSSPPRTPMRPTSGADRDEHELGGSPDDKSEASPSAQARPAAPPPPPPPPPPQSPLSRFAVDRADGSDTEEEDAPTSPPRTPPRRTYPRDSVRTPSLSPEMPFHPRTPPRTAPLERLDTADRALFDLIAQPGTWTESPSARLPRALSLSVSLDDLRATAAASIDLSAPPSAISFQPVGEADPALNAQLVAAGLRLDSSLSDAPRTDSPEPNADDGNLTVTVGSRVARELFGLPLPPPGQVTWVDAVKPAMSFAEWVAEHEAAAARETSEEDECAAL